MKININVLQGLDACNFYLRAFARLFPQSTYPDGVEVTPELCVRYAEEFDWEWAADELLTEEGYRLYEQALNDHPEARRLTELDRQAMNDWQSERTAWSAKYSVVIEGPSEREYRAIKHRYHERQDKIDADWKRFTAKLFAELSETQEAPKVALAFDGVDVDELDDPDVA
jgi:hypothetical protein